MEHRRVPLQSFSALWDNRLSTESRDIPLFGIKFCGFRTFLRHRRVSLRNDSVLWDKTVLAENCDPPAPSFLTLTFFDSRNQWNTKDSATKFFGTVRQKIFYRKTWYSLLTQKTCRHPKFYETQKGSSTKWFGTVRQNNFDGKSWWPPPLLSVTFFRYQKSEIQKGSSMNFFGTARRKKFDRKTSHIPVKTRLLLRKVVIFLCYAWKFWISKIFRYAEWFLYKKIR